MQIKKIIPDPFYKNEYYKVDDAIVEKEYAKSIGWGALLDNFEKAYTIASKKIKPTMAVKAEFRVLPSYDKMVEMIEKKSNQIIAELKLNEIKCPNADIVKAMVLMYYFGRVLEYNMTTKELVTDKIKNYQQQAIQIKNKINLYREALIEFDALSQSTTLTKKQEQTANEIINRLKKEHHIQKMTTAKLYNETLAASIFDALIYKKGVCTNFSYTYDYMLKKLNIQSSILEIATSKNSGHVFNLVKVMNNNTANYYMVDITSAINYKYFSPSHMLKQFGLTKQEKQKDLEKLTSIWKSTHFFASEVQPFEFYENRNHFETLKQTLTDRKTLKKQQKIAETFILVKLENKGLER